MKTTFELPDDLLRELKLRAVNENRRIKDVAADVIRRGLAAPPVDAAASRRVRLPLVDCAHRAGPEAEMTPERVAAILLGEEMPPVDPV